MIVKTPEQLDNMRCACRICRNILRSLGQYIRAGVSTREIEEAAERLMENQGVVSGFKGYRGYPGSLCISVNEEVVHGIPSPQKIFREGDIVSVDVGIIHRGFLGDCAETFPVGTVSAASQKLLTATRTALVKGIEKAVAGNRVGDISCAIQKHVESEGFSVVRDFAGHGIGTSLHENPEVPNFGCPGRGDLLEENMIIAIEPMVNEGAPWIRILSDGWTVITQDGKRSCHFEDTVRVLPGAAELLTL